MSWVMDYADALLAKQNDEENKKRSRKWRLKKHKLEQIGYRGDEEFNVQEYFCSHCNKYFSIFSAHGGMCTFEEIPKPKDTA